MPRKILNEELGRISAIEFKQSDKSPFVVVLDNVRSQNNIGSVFRTSDAFLVQAICLCGITACPPNKEIHKTALGAEDSVDWHYFENTADCIQNLKSQNFTIVAVEQAENSISLRKIKLNQNQKYALVFGNEVKGVDQEIVDLCDACIEIPQFGTKHSFNIAVSAGMVIWELFNKWKNVD